MRTDNNKIANDFEIKAGELDKFEVVFYNYDCANWEGYAFGLLRENTTGIYFEFSGSH